MKLRLFVSALLTLLIFALAGCEALQKPPYKKKDDEDKKPMKDQAGDQAFQSFLGRLRQAVAKRDHATLTSLMVPAHDFGYRWDTPPAGETPFAYWDQRNLWPELAKTLRETFVAHELYMVAPPAVATQPDYPGFRAGMRIVGGSWKFAYFVPAEGAQ
ncbi:MAG: hypothetical protein K8R23_10910 [Chthoniobacter sp.]|nr:hypothetical protein [Chthoniobacter sp.]